MIKCQKVRTASEKLEVLQSFDPGQSTWLVADLRSKLEIQKRLLTESPLLEEWSVLRASELWRKLAAQVLPDVRFVSADLVLTVLRQWMAEQNLSWQRGPGAPQQLMEFIQKFLVVFVHPDGDTLMQNWFNEHPQAVLRWQHWYELARRGWSHLRDLGLAPAAWAAGLLLDNVRDLQWKRPLIVDLSSQITAIEVEILLQMAAEVDVHVLVPAMVADGHYTELAQHYEKLGFKRGGNSAAWPVRASHSPQPVWRRYSTQLAEVKSAVGTIRNWLNAGIDAKRIGLLAPDIESYWPVVSPYLEVEGVPTQKPQVTRVQTLLSVQIWLSQLRSRIGPLTRGDLEQSVYVAGAGPISYERFYQIFANLYDDSDLNRDGKIRSLFARQLDMEREWTRDEFISWAVRFWPERSEVEPLELILQNLQQECPGSLTFPARGWLSYLERLSSKLEQTAAEGTPEGVYCGTILSSEWLNLDHVVAIGLHQEALVESSKISLSAADVQSLNQDLGFVVAGLDQAQQEFELQMLMQRRPHELQLSFAASDFSGQPLGPPLPWLLTVDDAKLALDNVDIPERTRWDEIQAAASVSDCAQTAAAQTSFGAIQPADLSLSASSLERYVKCPFIFAAERCFHLQDLPELDLDLDRMTRGSIMHALFEHLTKEPFVEEVPDQQLDSILEQVRESEKLRLADEKLWQPLKAKYIDLAKRFLRFESDLRKADPKAKTIGREVNVKGFWSQDAKCLVRERKSESDIPFRGRIDRVDFDGTNYTIIDYKSTSSGKQTHHKSWLGTNVQLQLPLYVQAIEAGLTELAPAPVAAALYYTAQPLAREKGFIVDGAKPYSRISAAEKSELFLKVNETVATIVERVLKGDLAPQPKEITECNSCSWRGLCRAPHLD